MFCYTSGTTGDPKAAMLSHKNLLSTSSATLAIDGAEIVEEDIVVSYLQFAHSFEKSTIVMSLLSGCKIGFYGGDIKNFMDDLQILQPTLFPTYPTMLNSIQDQIRAKI